MHSIFLLSAFVPSWQTFFFAAKLRKIFSYCHLQPVPTVREELKFFYPQDAAHECLKADSF